LVWTNMLQVLALGSIPVAFMLRILSLLQLFLVTFVMSVTIVFFAMAYLAYLPTLIDKEDLVEGNSKLQASESGSVIVGPALAGGLIQILGAALSVGADALGTLVAAVAIISIQKPEPPAPPKSERRFWTELRDGLSSVACTPSLRTLAVSTSILNIGNAMFYAVFLLFIYNQLKIAPVLAGVIWSAGGIGFLIGAVSAPTLLRRIGLRWSLLLALLINGIGRLILQTSAHGPAPVLLSAFWLLASIGIPIYNINQYSFRQAIVPDALQGRMNATMRTFGYGGATVGALIGGIMGSTYGIVPAMTTGAFIALLPVILIRCSPRGELSQMSGNAHVGWKTAP